jgi:PhoH-like ATPase
LPGDKDEKFLPYLDNYFCNIEYLMGGKKSITDVISQYGMEFIPLQLIRGSSWMNAFVIADEVQVLSYQEMVTLGTRVGDGSKIVIMGDLGQRDENIERDKTGLYKFVNSTLAKQSQFVATIELKVCERSEIAALFADIFEV